MRTLSLTLLVAAALLAPAADAARRRSSCLGVSGDAATQCLEDYTGAIEACRSRQDQACEDAALADGGASAIALTAPDRTDRAACDDASAAALGYLSADDVVQRGRNACEDFGKDLLGLAYGSAPDPLTGSALACQGVVASRLGRLRDSTLRLFGPGCYVREGAGHRCPRRMRDRGVTRARAAARRAIVRRCGTDLAPLGLEPLDPLLADTITRARHYAQQVYPPNDLGPSAEFGDFPIGVRTLQLEDAARANVAGTGPRPVTVEVYYPSTAAAVAGVPRDIAKVFGVEVAVTPAYRDVGLAPGTFPLVVFSHGNNGIRFQSVFFAAHLASHGYVVASPDHHGNTFVDTAVGVIDPDVATNRPRDMSFVIDQFLAFNADAGNVFAGAIDPERIGASGHSFGGFTAFALGGGASPLGSLGDARVKAILPQAPAAAFPDAYFATIHVPTLIIGGSIDETTPFAENQQRPYDLLPAGAKVVALADVADAGHFTFSDFCEVDRTLLAFLGGFDEACEPRHLPWRHAHDLVNYLSLNFFDAVLRDDGTALGRLAPDTVARIEDLTYQRK